MSKSRKTLTKKTKTINKRTPDILLIGLIILIVTFGVVMVYSASHYHSMNISEGKDALIFVRKQGIFAFIGICAMIFIGYKFNYRYFSNLKLAGGLYLFSIALSFSLFFIGHESKGAKRWILLPGGITFQPSEVAKIAVIIMLAAYIVYFRHKLNRFIYVLGGGLIILLPAGLIAAENLSSALVVILVGMIMLFISTPKVWYYILAVVGGIFLVAWAYNLAIVTPNDTDPTGIAGFLLPDYRLDRIRVWQDPWIDPIGDGYQPIQSLYAIGSGGVFGQGIGLGVQKLGFLPEPHNDIIFAVIAEELGLVGAGLLLLTYGILVLRGLAIAVNAYDLFGALLATGITSMVGVQVLINVAVNTNTIPTTGMQLPLVSYGGTALMILLGSLGLLINVSRLADIRKPMI